jgi:DNA invertase Pin-like site-specific DNA recombinase
MTANTSNGIAAYVRVSSRAQNLATQRDAIERAAAARGDQIGVWFAEKRSGKKLARPELDRVRAAVRAGEVRRLYVFKLDRVTRSGVADTYAVIEELRRGGCELHAPGDNLVVKPTGSDDLVSECIVFGLALGAREQRQAINDNIAAARERLAAQGKSWGRKPTLTHSDVEKARALAASGLSVRQVAVQMKVKRSTVHRAISAPAQRAVAS